MHEDLALGKLLWLFRHVKWNAATLSPKVVKWSLCKKQMLCKR